MGLRNIRIKNVKPFVWLLRAYLLWLFLASIAYGYTVMCILKEVR